MNPLSPQGAANLISAVVNQAIVRPLGDPYTIGISGLIFDIVSVVDLRIASDITDHYVEQNYAIQDHWAQKPIIVTVKGYAAEKVSIFIPNILSPLFTAITGLTPLAGLAPQFNTQDAQFYNTLQNVAQLGKNVVNTAMSVFQVFDQAATMVTRQQSVFNFLMSLWQSRTLCTVETPFAIFNNMAIELILPSQPEETTLISEFVVTFKQIKTVASITGTANVNSLASANSGSTSTNPTIPGGTFADITANTVNLGNDSGTANDQNGDPFTVASVSQNIYTQQMQPY